MKPIYKPKGRALEYSPDALALNIYTGCPHRCFYCFAPTVLKTDREKFHSHVEPRKDIVNATIQQLKKGYLDYDIPITDGDGKPGTMKNRMSLHNKLIHLCFTCDPYPTTCDDAATREIIKAIKDSGNHVQILTKGGIAAERDFDLLDKNDWIGITFTGDMVKPFINPKGEPYAAAMTERLLLLDRAKMHGLNTWVSCEPVLDVKGIYSLIKADYIDLFRIGKLNYHPSIIAWGEFGRECEGMLKYYGRQYYIKHDLRKEMEKAND